jgi:hypothetical protein
MPKHKYISTPEEYLEIWVRYKKSVKDNPRLKHVFVGKDGTSENEKRERALTWDGFEVFTMLEGYNKSADLSAYCDENNPSYKDYVPLSKAFKKECRADQIDGAATNVYNSGIIASLQQLKTHSETELKGGLNIPNLPDIGNRK